MMLETVLWMLFWGCLIVANVHIWRSPLSHFPRHDKVVSSVLIVAACVLWAILVFVLN